MFVSRWVVKFNYQPFSFCFQSGLMHKAFAWRFNYEQLKCNKGLRCFSSVEINFTFHAGPQFTRKTQRRDEWSAIKANKFLSDLSARTKSFVESDGN